MEIEKLDSKWVGQKIVGTWELVSWVYKDETGEEIDFFGPNPHGLLMYMDSGYMSVQIERSDRNSFTEEGFDGGSESEQASAFSSFFAYYGRYKEVEPGVFEHTVETSLFPNWKGDKHIRIGEIKDDLLVLYTPKIAAKSGGTIFYITWRKVSV